jgi:hypothetical protein
MRQINLHLTYFIFPFISILLASCSVKKNEHCSEWFKMQGVFSDIDFTCNAPVKKSKRNGFYVELVPGSFNQCTLSYFHDTTKIFDESFLCEKGRLFSKIIKENADYMTDIYVVSEFNEKNKKSYFFRVNKKDSSEMSVELSHKIIFSNDKIEYFYYTSQRMPYNASFFSENKKIDSVIQSTNVRNSFGYEYKHEVEKDVDYLVRRYNSNNPVKIAIKVPYTHIVVFVEMISKLYLEKIYVDMNSYFDTGQ